MSSIDAPGERKIVTFALGTRMFGIDMEALVEIREWETPTPLPSVPAHIKGVVNLRGNVVPVVGLAERLGWAASPLHARSCILVVNIAGRQAGFLVDEVADIVTIADKDVQPAPDMDSIDERYIAGLVQIATRAKDAVHTATQSVMVLLFDLDALSVTRQIGEAA